jgi:Tfp pilus assembly protein PilF
MNGEFIQKNTTAHQLYQQAVTLSASGDTAQALPLFMKTAELEPQNANALNEIGVILYRQNKVTEAKSWFQRAVDANPDFVRALTNLGACCNEEKDNARAVACYLKALKLQPNMLDAWGNLAKAWTESEEHEMAVYAYNKAIELNPKGEFYRGLAKAYRKSGRYDRSEKALKIAIEKNPDDHDAHFGLAYTYFHLERYAEGVQEFEWRWKTKDMVKHRNDLHPIFNAPAYDGSQDLSDKTVLIHTEQGFGDNLQFARFINVLRPHVKKLVMWTRPGLGKLLMHNFDIAEYSEDVFKLPQFDLQLPLLTIPYYFDKSLEQLNDTSPYLKAPPNDHLTINKPKGKLSIGLVWGASDSGFDHSNKRVPLELLRPLMEIEGTQWYSLQVGSDREDLKQTGKPFPIIDLADHLINFADTARIVEQLDLVVSVDTSVAHLAGAMGKEVLVMLKKNPDWRWHADGPGTTWYPSATLFRQDSFGDWGSVIRRIKKAVQSPERDKAQATWQ